jgi:hypothetical protein
VKRGRDRLGRPVPLDSPQALPDVPEQALPRAEALALAQALVDEGRCFAAHEVLEASWKAAPDDERALWQGLAQVCVGATHLQRGNRVGAARLLRRGAGQLDGQTAPDLAVGRVRAWALRLADAVDAGSITGGDVDAPRRAPDGPLRLPAP